MYIYIYISSFSVDTSKSGAFSNQKHLGYNFQRLLSFFSIDSAETIVYVCISPRLFDQHQESYFYSPLQDHKTYFWNLKVL